MFVQRTVVVAAARRAATASSAPAVRRCFTTSLLRSDVKKTPPPAKTAPPAKDGKAVVRAKTLSEIRSAEDLLAPGAADGAIPTDFDQSTGLERLELLGKMEGVDIFDMRPLDSSRTGTMDHPIMVRSGGVEQYLGCTGCPADSHVVLWLTISRDRPIERCPECGSVYKMEYAGPQDDPHDHGHDHGHHHHEADYPYLEEPKTFADFIKPEYRYR